MYIPKHYMGNDRDRTIAFMKQFNFGCIITSINGVPQATHLPFVVEERDENLFIISHFSKANEQCRHLLTNEHLVIFSEPHAYISPKHYDRRENVPTWNYVAVHAYGKAKIIDEKKASIAVLESMIASFEPDYKKQWDALEDRYKTKMLNGIVAFEISVTKLESKEKLSQNKKENERQSIIDALSKSQHANEKAIADYMTALGKRE